MKPNLIDSYGKYFFAFWIALGIGSWLWLRSRQTVEEKRIWHRRIVILTGVIFGAFLTASIAGSGHYFPLLIFLPALVLISYMNMHFTFFCDSCGKMSQSVDYFSRDTTYHCPKCGKQLRP